MTRFIFRGTHYEALTLGADRILKRCKDLYYLTIFGGADRSAEIEAWLDKIQADCLIFVI